MGACISKGKNSNAIVTAGLCAQLEMVFRAVFRLVPGLLLPSNPQHSVSLTITPVVDLNPAYANSPSTLALVLFYFRYNVCTPLFYLALVKHCVVFDDDDDDDDRKSITMVAPELAEESPLFGCMTAAELLVEIHKGRGLLPEGLKKRKSELEEELTSIEKWRRVRSEAASALSILLAVIYSAALVASKVTPASVVAMLLVSLAVVNLLVPAAIKVVGRWFGMTEDERKSQLEIQKDGIKAMCRELMRGELLLSELKQIRSLLENLKRERIALRATEVNQHTLATDNQADQGCICQTAAAAMAAAHLEREVDEKTKKVEEAIKGVRKMVDRIERKVREKAADFVNIISK